MTDPFETELEAENRLLRDRVELLELRAEVSRMRPRVAALQRQLDGCHSGQQARVVCGDGRTFTTHQWWVSDDGVYLTWGDGGSFEPWSEVVRIEIVGAAR